MKDLRPDTLHALLDSSRPPAPSRPADARPGRRQGWVAAAVLAPVAVWCYLPTLAALVGVWSREPRLLPRVLRGAVGRPVLWARRRSYPARGRSVSRVGMAADRAGTGDALGRRRYYLEALDGWSIAVWLGGVVGVFAGWRVFLWALPSLAFLLLAVPLPFRAERAFSLPLQRVATELSCWILQMLGQPALAVGNTIVLGDLRLEVQQACSGLRIFVGIAALAYVYVVLVRPAWWEKVPAPDCRGADCPDLQRGPHRDDGVHVSACLGGSGQAIHPRCGGLGHDRAGCRLFGCCSVI